MEIFIPLNAAWVWQQNQSKPLLVKTAEPENEIDGNLFWIWSGLDGIMLNCENFDGQARKAAQYLINLYPLIADIEVMENSPCNNCDTLREFSEDIGTPIIRTTEIEKWYHGTCSIVLDNIMQQGLSGNMPYDKRAWQNVMDPDIDIVYLVNRLKLAEEYAHRAARILGGEPVIVEIVLSSDENHTFIEDRDFRHTGEWKSYRSGDMDSDITAADASLTYTGRVGFCGAIPASRITTVHKTSGGEWVAETIHNPSP